MMIKSKKGEVRSGQTSEVKGKIGKGGAGGVVETVS